MSAREVPNYVVFMDEGVIGEQGTPGEIFERAQRPRAKSFLAKVLELLFSHSSVGAEKLRIVSRREVTDFQLERGNGLLAEER